MSSKQTVGTKKKRDKLFTISNILRYVKEIPDLLLDFKNTVLVIFVWIIVSEVSGHSVIDLLTSIFRLIIYPINWLLFNTGFEYTGVPEVFILLIPLMLIVSLGFLILISTEN